ncbi:MAG TPA: hypothetical protein VEH08_06995 [Methanomassiliicoccales archaeon]|nr:hypothetical protein [Methanomassiliicoccales archaeon]
MTGFTYHSLLNAALRLYRERQFDQAYGLVTENADEVGGNPAHLLNFRYSLAAVGGHPDLAFEIIRSAVERGCWWSEDILMKDDDLAELRGRNDFLQLVGVCRERELREKAAARSECKVVESPLNSNSRRPFVVALHGNSESNVLSEPRWRTCLRAGMSLALVQSSCIKFSGGYSWDDPAIGRSELEGQWTDLKRGGMDERLSILGGFSAGGRVIVHAILNRKVDSRGAILVGPWLPDLKELVPLMDHGILKNKRFFILVGDEDVDCLDCSMELAMELERNGASVRLQIEPGLEHDFPVWFDAKLTSILSKMLS